MGGYSTGYDPEKTFEIYTVSSAFVKSNALAKLKQQVSKFVVETFRMSSWNTSIVKFDMTVVVSY